MIDLHFFTSAMHLLFVRIEDLHKEICRFLSASSVSVTWYLNWVLSEPSRAQVAFRFAPLLLSGRRYAEKIGIKEKTKTYFWRKKLSETGCWKECRKYFGDELSKFQDDDRIWLWNWPRGLARVALRKDALWLKTLLFSLQGFS